MMATFDEARAALSALLSQYENRRLYKRGSLGNGDGATVEVAGQPAIRLTGITSRPIQAMVGTTMPILKPVLTCVCIAVLMRARRGLP